MAKVSRKVAIQMSKQKRKQIKASDPSAKLGADQTRNGDQFGFICQSKKLVTGFIHVATLDEKR